MSRHAIIVTRLDGVVVSWGEEAERLFGFGAREMGGKSIHTVIAAEPSSFASVFARVCAGTLCENHPVVGASKTGQQLDLTVDLTPLRDERGSVVNVLVLAQDRNAHHRAETALLESEGRWRAVIASAVDAMIVIDAKGTIEVFNPAAERLFGFGADEVLGQNVSLLMPSPYREEHDGYIRDYLRTGRGKVIGIGREVTARRRDGTAFPVHLAVGEMSVGGETHFTGIIHDLTPRVALEERMREQTALARLGEMAAVIAHEVKNPLAAVRGAIQVVGRRLPSGSADGPIITEIVARIDALDELIKDLLLFARTPQPRLSDVDLEALLKGTAEFLSADPALKDVRVRIDGTAGTIAADPEMLRILFQNLLLNAAQAMQGRGALDVTLSSEGDVQQVVIADSGPGLTREARENLFRPFFTTKARGTGLGLPTAKRLVELHKGSIAVDSAQGRGTAVTVRLPVNPAT